MAGRIPGRLPKKEDLDRLKEMDRYLGDIGTKLSRLASGHFPTFEKSIQSFIAAREKAADLQRQLSKMAKEQSKLTKEQQGSLQKLMDLQTKYAVASNKARGKIQEKIDKQRETYEKTVDASKEMQESIEETVGTVNKLSTGFGGLAKVVGVGLVNSLESVLRSIAKIGIDTLSFSFQKLEDGVQRVYELFERWTRALGAFNMQVGGISPNIEGAIKIGKAWESQIRGLTDHFGEGLQMYSEFVSGFGRVLPEAEAEKWGKIGIAMARGLGMGGQAAGEFLKAAYQMAQTPDEMKATFGDIVSSANAAGVSVNKFSQELNGSRDFMTGFGKEGRKLFVEAAGFAKKLGVSLRSLQQFTKITDTFESAVGMASRLNTIFGTNINSLQLMLEQDPSKRLEMVRQEMLAQGKTFDQLSRQERAFFAEQMNLSQEEIAGTLQRGLTLDQFHAEQEHARKKQLNEDALMRKSQLATAQTMFAFGAAADQITMSLTHLLAPFLKIIGLSGEGKSFGQFFGDLTKKIVGFIDALASDPQWIRMMESAADAMQSMGKNLVKYLLSNDFRQRFIAVAKVAKQFFDIAVVGFKAAFEFISSERGGRAIDKLISGFSKLVEWAPELLALFGAMKAIQVVGAVGSAAKTTVGLAGMISSLGQATTGATGALGGMVGKLGGAALGLTAAATAGYAFGSWLNEQKWFKDKNGNPMSVGDKLVTSVEELVQHEKNRARLTNNLTRTPEQIFSQNQTGLNSKTLATAMVNIQSMMSGTATLEQKRLVAGLDLEDMSKDVAGTLRALSQIMVKNTGKGTVLSELAIQQAFEAARGDVTRADAPTATPMAQTVTGPMEPTSTSSASAGSLLDRAPKRTAPKPNKKTETTVNVELNLDSEVVARKLVVLSTD